MDNLKQFGIRKIDDGFYDDYKISRYMSYTKLARILKGSELWFSSLDQFTDKNEGTNFGDIKVTLSEIENIADMTTMASPEAQQVYDYRKNYLLANCWTIEDDHIKDNYLLWKNYVPGPEGIKVTTTVKDLKNSINGQNFLNHIYCGPICYDNVSSKTSDLTTKEIALYSAFIKKPAYKCEHEFRFIFNGFLHSNEKIDSNRMEKLKEVKGKKIPLRNGGDFINFVSPNPFEKWGSFELIRILKDHFGDKFNPKFDPSEIRE